ncbi:MAG: phage terminase large subunit [Fimbriimonas sp.]|nr:phage terminase large subunit [Fimbriimonas sp.]
MSSPFAEWLAEVSPIFKWHWPHLVYIRERLEAHALGEIRNLMVLCPPQHGKSELVTVRYPVYRLESDPRLRVVVSAYNQSYVDKLARKIRRIAVARNCFKFASDRNAASEWELAAGGGLLAVGIGGGLTGNPAELAIIDDPIKGREDAESETYREKVWEWYVDELSTRIQQDGQKVLVLTPWHEDDLRGRILNSSEAKRWAVVKLPAICESTNDPLGRSVGEPLCPERRTLEWLLEQKALGERSFQALYQCDPTPREGSFFKVGHLVEGIRSEAPIVVRWCRAWDLASSKGGGDYTVGVLMGIDQPGRFWILDVVRGQWSPDERNERMRQAAALDGVRTPIRLPQDPGQAGKEQAQALTRMLAGFAVKAIPVSGDKQVRADPFAAQVNAGNVMMIRASWNAAFVEELRQFPNGRHDDSVDAASDAFNELTAGHPPAMPTYMPPRSEAMGYAAGR